MSEIAMKQRARSKALSLALIHALLIFCSGAFLVALIVVMTSTIPQIRFLFEAHTFGPMSEEVFKFAASFAFLSIGSAAFLPLLGLSFGIFEAIRHVEVYGTFGEWAVVAHIAFGIIMSAFLYLGKRTPTAPARNLYYMCALCIPVVLHFTYNTVIVPYL
jgi:hypothetical protein